MVGKKKILQWIIILSLIGVIVSIYLINNHYAPPQSGALCDVGKSVSCSVVNTSIFSELFNVPVALLGELWFIILILMCLKARTGNPHLPKIIYRWSLIGLLFVVYMIIAEIILQAICPFCTVLHVIVFINFFLARKIFNVEKNEFDSPLFSKVYKKWLIFIAVVFLIPFWMFNFTSIGEENYDQLAQCLTEEGMTFYSSYRCGYCMKTKEMFGDSMIYIEEVECHPKGLHSQTELCVQKEIEGTPAWVMEKDGEEVKRHEGFMNIEALKEFSGCE